MSEDPYLIKIMRLDRKFVATNATPAYVAYQMAEVMRSVLRLSWGAHQILTTRQAEELAHLIVLLQQLPEDFDVMSLAEEIVTLMAPVASKSEGDIFDRTPTKVFRETLSESGRFLIEMTAVDGFGAARRQQRRRDLFALILEMATIIENGGYQVSGLMRMRDETALAQHFTRSMPIGTRCRYYPRLPATGDDFEETIVVSEPWHLGHGAAVVKIESRSGGVSIKHVFPIENT